MIMSEEIKTGNQLIVECCDCGLQHIWTFEVVRGKFPQDDKIVFNVFRQNKINKNNERNRQIKGLELQA